MAPRRDDRFRDRDTSSSAAPIILIIGLAVGIPALLIVLVGACIFGFTAWVGNKGRQFIAEAERQQQLAVARQMELQAEAQREAIERAKNPNGQFGPFDNQPIVELKPARPPGVPGKPLIDLIPLLDVNRDAQPPQKWRIADNALRCTEGHFVPRVEIPYQPPAEYDFTATFSQPGLRNGISLIMPNPNGGSFFWYLGTQSGSGFGFGRANGQMQDQPIPGLIKPQIAYTTTVQVRRTGVRALLDGKELINHPTDFRDLGTDNWRRLKDPTVLAIACDDPTVFHFVQVVEITGTGKRLR